MNTVLDVQFMHRESHGGIEAAVLLNDFQWEGNLAAVCSVPEKTKHAQSTEARRHLMAHSWDFFTRVNSHAS